MSNFIAEDKDHASTALVLASDTGIISPDERLSILAEYQTDPAAAGRRVGTILDSMVRRMNETLTGEPTFSPLQREDVENFIMGDNSNVPGWFLEYDAKKRQMIASTTSDFRKPRSSEQTTDPVKLINKKILADAKSFLLLHTGIEGILDITKHASAVAQVMAEYDIQGQETPLEWEIDTVYLKLTVLQCQFHIDIAKAELQRPSPEKAKIQHALVLALDVAKVLSKGYKNDSLLQEVQELQRKIDLL